MRSILVNEILKQALYLGCKNRAIYEGGKATDKYESTVISVRSKEGEYQIILPFDARKCEDFNNKFTFGDKIEIEDIVDVRDIKVSIYKDSLLVKVLADYKED